MLAHIAEKVAALQARVGDLHAESMRGAEAVRAFAQGVERNVSVRARKYVFIELWVQGQLLHVKTIRLKSFWQCSLLYSMLFTSNIQEFV